MSEPNEKKTATLNQKSMLALSTLLAITCCTSAAIGGTLKTHGVFSSNMVIQRDKPITIWGWAEPGRKVSVQFGEAKTEATAEGETGRWEVTFPAQPANAASQKLIVASGDEELEMENILIGDVWVMNGQSNMAFGLADLKDPEHTAFIPGYDQQIPGLHPVKKQIHGLRAARWALSEVYGMRMDRQTAELVAAKRDGDQMLLTFDKPVMPDDMSIIPEGFSIAGEDGKFYMAHAAFQLRKDDGIWNTANESFDATKIYVWSPLVEAPVAVRYAWARSPMGNLKVNGKPWQPLRSFRTDQWSWPESDDPAVEALDRAKLNAMAQDAANRCERRKTEEARKAVEILETLKQLGRTAPTIQ